MIGKIRKYLFSDGGENDRDCALLLLRLSFGALLAFSHGIPKIKKLFHNPETFPDPIGIGPIPGLILATLAEFGCSLLVMAGVRTRLASIPVIFTMAVAVFVQHAGDPWSKKEFALVYLLAFLTIFIAGPGRFRLRV